ncbi:SsgA family sporulation/cell division regulator [Streptosporangium canum]|uniref:SsgA family sporulation/cell division regulator n=1 Tax=Streptosporangium canum TaxID=324952 RepID=UPI00369AA50A
MRRRRATKGLTLWPADRLDYPVPALLTYNPTDPYMVRLAFLKHGRETVVYHLSRRLLMVGLRESIADSSATVGPHEDLRDYLVLTLNPAGAYPYTVYAERKPVQRLLIRSYALVPGGQEDAHISAGLDAALTAILTSEVAS